MVFDGSDVVSGVEINARKLAELAIDLCDEDQWHKDLPKSPEQRKYAEENFEAQVKSRGYCNECQRLAGFILSKFDITERVA